MTEVIKPERAAPNIEAGSLAEALNDVSRSAQQLLADVGSQPLALRIRAGDVVVELEWPAHAGSAHSDVKSDSGTVAEGPIAQESPVGDGFFDLCAPTVGTFYVAHEPGAAPFVTEGDVVRKGQQVGIVEAMKLMIPIEAERDGQVVGVLAANGSSVEYGDKLFTFTAVCAG